LQPLQFLLDQLAAVAPGGVKRRGGRAAVSGGRVVAGAVVVLGEVRKDGKSMEELLEDFFWCRYTWNDQYITNSCSNNYKLIHGIWLAFRLISFIK